MTFCHQSHAVQIMAVFKCDSWLKLLFRLLVLGKWVHYKIIYSSSDLSETDIIIVNPISHCYLEDSVTYGGEISDHIHKYNARSWGLRFAICHCRKVFGRGKEKWSILSWDQKWKISSHRVPEEFEGNKS